MKTELTCIICPNSCQLEIESEQTADGLPLIQNVCGAFCPKGVEYARQEILSPCRTISTSIAILHGELPLVSVRLTNPIPKDRIFDAIAEIKSYVLEAPVSAGTILISQILGYNSDVIITKTVPRKSSN